MTSSGSARATIGCGSIATVWTGESGVGPGGKDGQPFRPVGPGLLEIKTITKTATPESYQWSGTKFGRR